MPAPRELVEAQDRVEVLSLFWQSQLAALGPLSARVRLAHLAIQGRPATAFRQTLVTTLAVMPKDIILAGPVITLAVTTHPDTFITPLTTRRRIVSMVGLRVLLTTLVTITRAINTQILATHTPVIHSRTLATRSIIHIRVIHSIIRRMPAVRQTQETQGIQEMPEVW